MKYLIKEVIEKSLKNKDYCDGCIFLRKHDQYNHYGDDIFEAKYDFDAYQCIFGLTKATLSLGYGKAKELIDSKHTLIRDYTCKGNISGRTTTYLEKIIKSMDLGIIQRKGKRQKEKEKIDEYIESMIFIIEKIIR